MAYESILPQANTCQVWPSQVKPGTSVRNSQLESSGPGVDQSFSPASSAGDWLQ